MKRGEQEEMNEKRDKKKEVIEREKWKGGNAERKKRVKK